MQRPDTRQDETDCGQQCSDAKHRRNDDDDGIVECQVDEGQRAQVRYHPDPRAGDDEAASPPSGPARSRHSTAMEGQERGNDCALERSP
jgi:hypothetical protein